MSERAREGLGGTRRTPPLGMRKPGPTTGTGLHAGALGTGSVSAQFSSRTTGALTASTSTDADGHYRLRLPPPGHHVLTVLDPGTLQSRSVKIFTTTQSAAADVDLTPALSR